MNLDALKAYFELPSSIRKRNGYFYKNFVCNNITEEEFFAFESKYRNELSKKTKEIFEDLYNCLSYEETAFANGSTQTTVSRCVTRAYELYKSTR